MNKFRFEFTAAEAQQLLWYIEDRDRGDHAGWYVGSKGAFERRHARIKAEMANWTRQSLSAGSNG